MGFDFSRGRGGKGKRAALVVAGVVAGVAGFLFWRPAANLPAPGAGRAPAIVAVPGAVRPALTVRLAVPQREDWPIALAIDGNVAAWQEAVIGAELGNYRIAEVGVQVGDRVKKGQVLARIADDAVVSELAEARASVEELQAAADEARGNVERAQALRAQGFYSTQMHSQFTTVGRTAEARLAAARARLGSAELRMRKTRVMAPDDGVISARSATVGSLTQPGQELFRLIRGGRLEWQAELPAATLSRVTPGAEAKLVGPGGEAVRGKVRSVAPSVDPRTRNGIVYVDLPAGTPLRAGMFARGEIEIARAVALTLPQSALVLREGFGYVFGIAADATGMGDAGDRVARVEQIRVKVGRRSGERVEIVEGLRPGMRVVASGAGFLTDGDVVRVVESAAVAVDVAGHAAP